MASRGVIISPPPDGTEAHRWWSQGAADNQACNDEGLTPQVREVRDCLEGLARLNPDETAASIVGSLACIYVGATPGPRPAGMLPVTDRRLEQVHWVDATNVAGGWHDADDLASFATDGAWECSNTGWLVWEDDKCIVLAGRMTDDGKQVGLIERIPKAAITARKTVVEGRAR